MTEYQDQVTDRTMSNMLAFLRGLRRLGLQITSDDERVVLEAIGAVGWESEQECRNAVAAVVVRDPSEYALFSAAWHQFWLWLRSPKDSWLAHQTLMGNVMRQKSPRHRSPQVIWMGTNYTASNAKTGKESDPFTVRLKAGLSREEVLRQKDFAQLTDMELEELMRSVPYLKPIAQKSRRTKQSSKGKRLCFHGTMRKSTAVGEILHLTRQRPVVKPRPVVLLCDISGSMDQYSRVLLRFAHALTVRQKDFEVFVFSTRLTRITRWLQLHDANDAFHAVSSQVDDWSGGTRLAENLNRFYNNYANTVLHHRAVMLLATDGFDSDNPEMLERQMSRLSRRSQHVVWLNPIAGDPAYTPTATGAKILDHCADYVFPAHNFNALTRAWNAVRRLPATRPVRRQRLL